MKKIVCLFAMATLLATSCREEPKEEIHLGDYNHPETEGVRDSTAVDSISSDSMAVGSGTDKVSMEK